VRMDARLGGVVLEVRVTDRRPITGSLLRAVDLDDVQLDFHQLSDVEVRIQRDATRYVSAS
jgi:hypothetical protein